VNPTQFRETRFGLLESSNPEFDVLPDKYSHPMLRAGWATPFFSTK
jgi:hypothetical protein